MLNTKFREIRFKSVHGVGWGGVGELWKIWNYGTWSKNINCSKITINIFLWHGLQIKWKSYIKKFHFSMSIIGEVDEWPKWTIKKVLQIKKFQIKKKSNKIGLANQIYKVHKQFHRARSIKLTPRRAKVKNVDIKKT